MLLNGEERSNPGQEVPYFHARNCMTYLDIHILYGGELVDNLQGQSIIHWADGALYRFDSLEGGIV